MSKSHDLVWPGGFQIEARYRAIFENPVLGICISSVPAGGRIVEANRVYQEMQGYSGQELSKRTIFDLTHPEDLPRHRELFSELTSGNAQLLSIREALHSPRATHNLLQVIRELLNG